ncbi:U32 family peptidase, partial [Bifidobacterium animalis]|nr:U32 family peptidase [Bifidobacterium animalis]
AGRSTSAYYVAAMTNAYKTAVNGYTVQRGLEDEAGNELKPFQDRVVRAGEEGFSDSARDTIMLNADAAFDGMTNWD